MEGIPSVAGRLRTRGQVIPREPQSTRERPDVTHIAVGGEQPGSEALHSEELQHCHVLTSEGSGPV